MAQLTDSEYVQNMISVYQHEFPHWESDPERNKHVQRLQAIANRLEGWQEWPGGYCSLDPTTRVEVQFREGGVCSGSIDDFYWEHDSSDPGADVVQFRITE